MSVEKYLVDEVFADAESPDPDGDFAVEQLLRAVLPRILAAHRADVLREIALLPTRPTRGELLRMADEAVAVYDPPQSETQAPPGVREVAQVMASAQVHDCMAQAAVERVRALHRQDITREGYVYCADCDQKWPCPTICALDGGDA